MGDNIFFVVLSLLFVMVLTGCRDKTVLDQGDSNQFDISQSLIIGDWSLFGVNEEVIDPEKIVKLFLTFQEDNICFSWKFIRDNRIGNWRGTYTLDVENKIIIVKRGATGKMDSSFADTHEVELNLNMTFDKGFPSIKELIPQNDPFIEKDYYFWYRKKSEKPTSIQYIGKRE